MNIRLSIIIPVFNRFKFIERTLTSVLNSWAEELDEIIIIDDGSTDSPELLLRDYPVRLFRHATNKGVGCARNLGIRSARGEFITFVDSDDVLCPNAFSARLDYLLEHPCEPMVCGTGDNIIDKNDRTIGSYHDYFQFTRPPYRLSKELLNHYPSPPVQVWLGVFRSALFTPSNMFFEDLPCGEDYDWFCRQLEHRTIPVMPFAVGHYRIHGENISVTRVENELHTTPIALAARALINMKYKISNV